MKILILILFIGFCSSKEQLKTEAKCSCVLRLSTGQVLENVTIPKDSIVLDKCDTKDYTKCEEECNQKISNETNGYDLDKPKAKDEESLGQSYCNKIKKDVKVAKFMLFVTLECKIERDIKDERNGTVVSIGTSISESSITRYIGSGFKQKIGCVDNKYTKIE